MRFPLPSLKSVAFPSRGTPAVLLEGMFHSLEGEGEWPAAVVCHPHPLGGGTMHNAVVSALARALAARGVMALRFNFRGVERSGGEHDNGRGEQADVAGALDWLLAQPGVDPWRVFVVGYSFGAWVGVNHAQSDPRVTAVATVGLVAWHYDIDFFRSQTRPDLRSTQCLRTVQAASLAVVELEQYDAAFLQSFTRPKLFITGENDPLAPPAVLRRLVDRIPEPKRLHVVPGADHSLRGREQEVGKVVAEFLAGL